MYSKIIFCLFFSVNIFAQNTNQISSDDAIIRLTIADNMAKSNQFDLALAAYDDIIDFHSDYVDAYMRRGVLLAAMGRIPEAIQDYNTAKQLDPYVVEVFDLFGRINKMKVLKGVEVKNTEDAAKALFEVKRKIRHDPENSILLYTSANLRVLLGDYLMALKDYNKAIQLKKDFVEAIYNRGIVHIILGENTTACEDFLESSKMGSERGAKKYRFFCEK
jgi:tetratricopeptide (TPR) repeat protein